MKRQLSLGKYLIMPIILLFISLLSVFLGSISAKATTTSLSPDLNINVGSAVSLVLTNCDGSNSSVLKLAIDPTPNGTFKSACQTTSVGTNTPGYSLTVRASSSDLNYLNPNTLQTLPIIPSTTNPISTPATLSSSTWGFAVEGVDSFDASYTENDSNNNYANLPTSDTTIYNTSEWPIVNTDHTFYYAAKVDTDTVAGTYGTTITYTVIGEAPTPVPCTTSYVVICVKVTEPGTIAIQNLWTTPITYTINGSDKTFIESGALSSDVNVSVGDIFEIEEGIENSSFRSWGSTATRGLVTNTTTTGVAKVSITKMPKMNRFTTDTAGTTAGNNFFRFFAGSNGFSYTGAINSLPADSFDISGITTVGNNFFYGFNYFGTLTSLPADSFDISGITTVGNNFFSSFNFAGFLTSLPVGSFDISGITTIGTGFFASFNRQGLLTSLPADSFDISGITTVGNNFFYGFNYNGAIASLPISSFSTNNIISVGSNFFDSFNFAGALTSLPVDSFNIGNIKTAGTYFFATFNANSKGLISLPADSFDISGITTVGNNFFNGFNSGGSLISLPVGSFNTSNITTTGTYFFGGFNSSGALVSLPVDSFNIGSVETAGDYFFNSFNYSGSLTSLPVNSFNTNNITSAGNSFFNYFNGGSASNTGRLQAGSGAGTDIIITNKSSSAVTFWQRPFSNPEGTAFSTSVLSGESITFLAG